MSASRRATRMRAILIAVATVVVLAGPAMSGRAEDPCGPQPCVLIDQASGTARYVGYGLEVPLSDVKQTEVPLRAGDHLTVVLTNANGLTYDYGKEVKEEAFVEKDALFKYLGGLNEGIPLLLKAATKREPSTKAFSPATALAAELAELSKALAEKANELAAAALYLERLQDLVLDGLQRSEEPDDPRGKVKSLLEAANAWKVPGTASSLSDSIEIQRKRLPDLLYEYYATANKLVTKLAEARSAAAKAEGAPDKDGAAARELNARIVEVEEVAAKLPKEAPDLYRGFSQVKGRVDDLEKFASGSATDDFERTEVAQIEYSWDKVANVTIAAARKPALSGKIAYRKRKFEKVSFRVVPEWPLQPAIGAGLVWADTLVYDGGFEKQKVGSATFVASTKQSDSRFQLFPVISLAPRFLSRIGPWYGAAKTCKGGRPRSGWAVTIDLGWNAKTDTPAYLAGLSVVLWRQIKLGGGVLWQRREVLDGMSAGQPIGADDPIRLRDSYPPSVYLMFSLLGWPPFASGS
jgi:hypothetical protein